MQGNEVPSPPPSVQPVHHNETDLNRFFNHSLDLLCVAGLDGYFKQVNPAWTNVLGWSKEELMGRPIVDFMHEEDRERTLQARANLAKGIPLRGLENRYLCKNGDYRWLSWQSTVEPGAGTVFAIARDITARRQADKHNLVLSKLDATGILAGGIAHDFNNLFTGLLLNLELVPLTGPINSQQEKFLQKATESVHAAKDLTKELIAFAEAGLALRKPVDLPKLLRKAMELALNGSTISFESASAPDLWPVEIDENQIARVIRNLMANAREAMPSGGSVSLKSENLVLDTLSGLDLPPGDYVRISITDAGPGITQETLSKIFDPYFSTKERGVKKGMGLGLTICHAIIRKHGGLLTIDSGPGPGTTANCYLPAARTVQDQL